MTAPAWCPEHGRVVPVLDCCPWDGDHGPAFRGVASSPPPLPPEPLGPLEALQQAEPPARQPSTAAYATPSPRDDGAGHVLAFLGGLLL
jgi:hypothetical protein